MFQKTKENSRFKRILEVYSRLKDTSLVPRYPQILGHKPTSKEKLHSILNRLEGKRFSMADRQKIRSLLTRGASDNEDLNTVDSARLDDINKPDNLHHQRQVLRNRRAQRVHKVLESVFEFIINEAKAADSLATRKSRVIFFDYRDKTGKKVSSRKEIRPARQIYFSEPRKSPNIEDRSDKKNFFSK